ncbi:caspase recruitment domain-containing protein 14-like isoform X2 [Mytilus californianus]|uniref:caspase recruitment domain-containing protein 14-like isoform X2 n=1 Tax=Mytilus californianus TaxID=6549 RepID=UPI002246CC11|nr:caspase recruitment domain-containing protein 14-like isoform X2 [Mytilus californianus]
MSASEEDDSIYDKLIEPNRYRIVKYFDPFVVFDIMRSKGVFTMDDQERVMNMYPPTRRARAGQFLDILQTKGDNGVKIFIEVLEYDYPHVYKLITNKDAKEPPRTFKQHRESIRSKWIDKTGELVDMIKNQFMENVNLRENLEDLKAVVTLNQENIQASENESNELRDKMRIISGENDELKEQNSSLLRERDRLKDDNLKIQKECIEYFKERDLYKDRIRHIQQEKDYIEQEINNLKEHIKQLKIELKLNRTDVRTQKFEKIQNRLQEIKTEQDTLSRTEMEKQILRDELAETQVKVEELVEEMDNLRVELDKSQADCSKLREKIEREKKERTQLEQWRQEKDKTIENYFERIGELELDKQNLEGERNREQQKNRELDLKISKLFSEKHQWQQSVETYRQEISELKKRKSMFGNLGQTPCVCTHQHIRNEEVPTPPGGPVSGEVVTEQPGLCCPPVPCRLISEGASNKSSESSEDLTECIQLEVALDTLPWTIDQCAGRPVSGPFIRSGSYEDTREKWTVKMKMPLLDKMTICGGNFTGIFVEKTKKKENVLKPGDKIESMCKITEEYEQQDRTSFDGFTQSQAKEKLSFKHHSDEMEVTFRRRKINNTPEFDCAKLWMADAKNSKRGDYFYVRANSPYNPDGSPGLPKHKIQTGDIFLVQDTCPVTAGEWQALKFDKKRGDWGPLCQSIPDSNHSRRQLLMNRQQSSDPKQGRHRAFKKRSLYTNVFPMKATSKLPVWMVGPQDVVLAIQNLMCLHYPAEFVTAQTGNFQQVMAGVRMQDKHVLMHINTQSSTDRIGILLLFSILSTDKQKLSEILKKNVTPDATTINEEILRQQGLDIGEVKIPCNGVKDETTLVDTVYNKINNMQKQILWLCENRLRKYKPDVLRDYKCFFTESNFSMAYSRFNSSQDEQSNTGQETMSNTGQETSSNTGKEEPFRVRHDSIALDRDVCNSWAEEDHC